MGVSSITRQLAEAQGPQPEGYPLSMRRMFAEATQKHSESKAVVSMYQRPSSVLGIGSNTNETFLTWTYDQLNKESDRLAASLLQRGISQGDRVAVFLFNGAEWALLFWACVKLGATFVPLDPRSVSKVEEVRHYLQIIKPVVLVVGDGLTAESMQRNNATEVHSINLRLVADIRGKSTHGWITLKDIFLAPDRLHSGLAAIKEIPIDMDEDVVIIVFTSGTSSLPKACPHNNTNLWASWASTVSAQPIHSSDLIIQHLPPSHIFACKGMMTHWIAGAAVVYASKSFDAGATLDAIEQFQCTHMSAIPSLLLSLLDHPFFKPERVKSLTLVTLGSTVITPEILLAATDKSKLGAPRAIVGFGMSEGLTVLGTSTDRTLTTEGGFLGLSEVFFGAKIKVCEAGTRRVLERGEIGELHFGGNMRIGGYLDGDDSCFYSDDRGQWISTGDQAKMDVSGTIYILGRYKDIIIRAGENISPVSIETCLNKAGVMAQVVGVPDEISGEVPLAVIQQLRPGPLPIENMQRFVELELGQSKMPTAFLTLEDLGIQAFPSTTSGKIRKQDLRQLVLAHLTIQHQQQKEKTPQKLMVATTDTKSVESALLQILSTLIGLREQSIPRDIAIYNLTDSINILRFQAAIRQRLNKNVATSDIMSAGNIKDLAELVTSPMGSRHTVDYAPKREGPPQTEDMVHTQGERSLSWRTRQVIEPILLKLNSAWSEVEDIFPIPDLSSRAFETTRPMAFSIRASFLARSASRDQLRLAIEATVQQWEMFRSIAVTVDNRALFVTLRAGGRWSKAAITETHDVKTPQDINSLGLAHGEKISVHPRTGGPLARFFIANIRSTGTAGLLIIAHHSIFDNLSFQAFNSDLESYLANNPPTWARTPYKLFADMYFQHSTSLPAQISVSFHVNRLRGVSSSQRNIWPPQRCVGWHIGDDHGYQVSPAADPTLARERTQIDKDGGTTGLMGIKTLMRLEDLSLIRTTHRISTPVLFKAACAMLNTRLSGTQEALFANTQAGRTWPFMDPTVAPFLPDAITVAGSTLALAMNRIGVYGYETTGDFLTRLEEEQQALTAHAHAPTASIAAQLNAADSAAFLSGRRQLMDWNLSTLSEGGGEGAEKEMRALRVEGFTETMLCWHCGMAGPDVVNLIARWDGSQFGRAEVEGWVTLFIKAMGWVAAVENWERRMSDFVW